MWHYTHQCHTSTPSAESRIKTPLSWNFLWILSLALSLSYLCVLLNLPQPTGQSQDVHSFFLCCTSFQREAKSLGLRWLGSLQKRWLRTVQGTDSWPKWFSAGHWWGSPHQFRTEADSSVGLAHQVSLDWSSQLFSLHHVAPWNSSCRPYWINCSSRLPYSHWPLNSLACCLNLSFPHTLMLLRTPLRYITSSRISQPSLGVCPFYLLFITTTPYMCFSELETLCALLPYFLVSFLTHSPRGGSELLQNRDRFLLLDITPGLNAPFSGR